MKTPLTTIHTASLLTLLLGCVDDSQGKNIKHAAPRDPVPVSGGDKGSGTRDYGGTGTGFGDSGGTGSGIGDSGGTGTGIGDSGGTGTGIGDSGGTGTGFGDSGITGFRTDVPDLVPQYGDPGRPAPTTSIALAATQVTFMAPSDNGPNCHVPQKATLTLEENPTVAPDNEAQSVVKLRSIDGATCRAGTWRLITKHFQTK